MNFAGLSGDFVELHVSETYSAAGPFGKRIAHGALVFSISTGLSVQMNQIQDTVVAFYGVDKLRFTKPVFIGDTIHVAKKVIAKQPKGERTRRGYVGDHGAESARENRYGLSATNCC